MNAYRLALVAFVTALTVPAVSAAPAKSSADVMPPTRRQATVDTAVKLTRDPVPEPLPPDLPQPFNPAGFEQPDPSEVAAGAARPAAGTTAAAGPAPGPTSDREILERLAAHLTPSGTIGRDDQRMLLMGGKRFEKGTTFTVTDKSNNQDYELELVAIDRTTFTLRYRGEEITRPIKPVK